MGKPEKTNEKPEPAPTAPGRKMYFLIAAAAIVIVAAAAIAAFVVFGPQVATKGDKVSVYYTGMFENGTVFGSNVNGTPLEFILGNASNIPPGFQDAIVGMSISQSKTVPISVALVRTVNRTGPIANTTFVEGQVYAIHRQSDNATSFVKILNVTPTTVTWDENGLLAGQNLTFIIKLVGISKTA